MRRAGPSTRTRPPTGMTNCGSVWPRSTSNTTMVSVAEVRGAVKGHLDLYVFRRDAAARAAGQMTGGRPSLVIRHTVDQRIGRRSPHGVRTPSAKPPAHARRPFGSRVRARVSRVQVPR